MGQRISALPQFNTLYKKIAFSLGMIAIYRVGVAVPIPGVNTAELAEFFKSQGANLLGTLNMFSGGALERFSIFALGVMPYISASIIAQLLTAILPQLESLQKEGESGRRKINQYTRYATVVLALFQGFMISSTLASGTLGGGNLVADPSLSWRVMTTISLTAGTCFVMWLGEQITDRGIGNGISLIIFAGIVAGLPSIVTSTYEKYNSQEMTLFPIIALLAICVLVCAGVVFFEQAARQVPIQYAKRQVGRRQYGGQSTFLPLRINSAGVIPPIFASSLLNLPATVVGFYPNHPVSNFFGTMFGPSGWLYYPLYVLLIVFFAYFYTSMTFKPDDIAENLKKNGGFVPGIRPGAPTSDYLQKIIDRLTLSGAIYLSAICVLPAIVSSRFNVQFYFGGTSLLIVVGVALDTFRQIEAHRQSLRYDSFLNPGAGSRATRIRPR